MSHRVHVRAALLGALVLTAAACRPPSPKGGVGDPCTADWDCTERCYAPSGGDPAYCTVACDPALEAPCPAGYTCEDSGQDGWICLAVPLGAPCAAPTDCASGACRGDVCSECAADTDCPGAMQCEDDRAGVGFFVCLGGPLALGEACAGGVECATGFCETPGDATEAVCSECEAEEGCAPFEDCRLDETAGYFLCQ